ncbi:SLBB domain-containing protein, partial [Bacteroidia bacterium]|nr:SLBB domain-containing protein [Bacteroidia bacterium]
DHYILDVGDKVTINIFGKSQADLIYQIENDGFIRPSGMYKINLKGVQFGKAKELLFKRFQQAYVFNRGQFNVELNTARTISVSIYGEVNHPGTYTISAFNNALGAIMAAGGPTGKASVRNIKLLSKGKEKLIDVYAFLNNPTVANSYGLTNNNVIYVQTIENRVSLSGPFLKSGTFELKTTENLADLIALAGGTRQNSILDNFNVVRVDGAIESLFTYDYETNKDLPLKDLDQISFKSSKEVYRNAVTIAGAVKFAGQYEVTKGLTLGELFNIAKLEEFARTDIAYVTRKNIDGTFKLVSVSPGSQESAKFLLRDEDQITILNQRSFTTNYFFSISGAVRNTLDKHFIDPDKTIRLSDAVLLAGGIQPNATDFAYLTSRKAENSKEVSYQMLDLKEALSNPGGVSDIVLSPYDQIVIPATENFQDSYQVSVMGSVRNPGSFSYDKTLTLKDLIVRSGGFKLEAATNKIDIFRLVIDQNNPTQTKVLTVEMDRELNPISSTDQIELQPFDMVVVRDVSGFSPIEMVTLQGEVKYPGQYAITRGTETLAEVIAAAGGLTKEAYLMNSSFLRSFDDVGIIRMNFKKALKRKKNKNHNIALRKNDVITIGKTSGIVLIGVNGTSSQEFLEDSVAKIAVPFYPGKVASYYIQHYAGGFKRDSRPSQTYVKHLDGTIKQAHNFLLFRVQRRVRNGSEIIISQKKEKQKQERRDRKKEESKLNLKDTVTEILTLMISAFTVVTLSNNL